jgi:hypothetical protein
MTNPTEASRSIDVIFTATVIADSNSGWPCVQMPDSAAFFGTGKAVKVAGTVDGHDYEATMLPVGGGTHMMPLRAPFRKTIKKGVGDDVEIHLTRRIT